MRRQQAKNVRYRAEYDESTLRLREKKLKYKAECAELVRRQKLSAQ